MENKDTNFCVNSLKKYVGFVFQLFDGSAFYTDYYMKEYLEDRSYAL